MVVLFCCSVHVCVFLCVFVCEAGIIVTRKIVNYIANESDALITLKLTVHDAPAWKEE